MKRFSPYFVILAAALWGVDGIVLRPFLYNLPVPLVVLIESGLVAILLSPLLIKFRKSFKELSTTDWFAFLGVAILGGAIGTMSITKALFYVNFVNLSIVIFIQKLQPVFAIIFAAVLLKEHLTKKFFVWSALAILGAYFMTFGTRMPNLETGDKTTVAALFALLAAICFAASTVLSKRALQNVSYELGTYLRFAFTTILMLMIVVVDGDVSAFSEVSISQISVFFLIAFTSGGLAILLYYYGLKNISASVATIAELAFPLTAVILEYLLRGNILGPVQWIGVLILIISILKVTKLNAPKQI